MISLEPTLSKISDAGLRRAYGAAQNRNGSRAKISSPSPPPFLPARFDQIVRGRAAEKIDII